MSPGDLTTLGNVLAWLTTQNYTSGNATQTQTVLRGLITRKSNDILTYLERDTILPLSVTNEAYDGAGGFSQYLKRWPVTSVQQLAIGGFIVPPSPLVPSSTQPPPPSYPFYGYRYEAWDGLPPGKPIPLQVRGIKFWMGQQNVQVSYSSGYLVPSEAWTIPAPQTGNTSTISVKQPYGIWAQDNGVTYASSGTALTPTPGNVAPTVAGTYQVLPADVPTGSAPDIVFSPPGQYVFFTGGGGDEGAQVNIAYGYIPSALEQVAIELIAARFVYRTRIGELTRNINQQVSVRYDDAEIPSYAKGTLHRYKRTIMLG
jgi:hypothetical protein